MEIWKDIPEYRGKLQVSSDCRIRSISRYVPFGHTTRYIEGKMLSTRKKSNGVVTATTKVDGKCVNLNVSEIANRVFGNITPQPIQHNDFEDLSLSEQLIYLATKWDTLAPTYIKQELRRISQEIKYPNKDLERVRLSLNSLLQTLDDVVIYKPKVEANFKEFKELSSEEIWKPIKGYKPYEVSSYGRVRRRLTQQYIRKSGKEFVYLNGCVKDGSKYVTLNKKVSTRFILIAKLVLMTFTNTEGYRVEYKDGNKMNCHLENLRWKGK